jgi:hypothetical protein
MATMLPASGALAEENCNWLEANVLALNCDLPRDTIVTTIQSVETEMESFIEAVEGRFSLNSLLTEEQLTTNIGYAVKFLNELKIKVVEHITGFLDDRRSQDQLSLLGFKKRMLDSVTTCRASVEQFRNTYDVAARQREKTSMEHFQIQTTRRFEEDTRELTRAVTDKTHENNILSKQMEFLMIQRESLQARLIQAHQVIRVHSATPSKKKKKGKHHKKGTPKSGGRPHSPKTPAIGEFLSGTPLDLYGLDSSIEQIAVCTKCNGLEHQVRTVHNENKRLLALLESARLAGNNPHANPHLNHAGDIFGAIAVGVANDSHASESGTGDIGHTDGSSPTGEHKHKKVPHHGKHHSHHPHHGHHGHHPHKPKAGHDDGDSRNSTPRDGSVIADVVEPRLSSTESAPKVSETEDLRGKSESAGNVPLQRQVLLPGMDLAVGGAPIGAAAPAKNAACSNSQEIKTSHPAPLLSQNSTVSQNSQHSQQSQQTRQSQSVPQPTTSGIIAEMSQNAVQTDPGSETNPGQSKVAADTEAIEEVPGIFLPVAVGSDACTEQLTMYIAEENKIDVSTLRCEKAGTDVPLVTECLVDVMPDEISIVGTAPNAEHTMVALTTGTARGVNVADASKDSPPSAASTPRAKLTVNVTSAASNRLQSPDKSQSAGQGASTPSPVKKVIKIAKNDSSSRRDSPFLKPDNSNVAVMNANRKNVAGKDASGKDARPATSTVGTQTEVWTDPTSIELVPSGPGTVPVLDSQRVLVLELGSSELKESRFIESAAVSRKPSDASEVSISSLASSDNASTAHQRPVVDVFGALTVSPTPINPVNVPVNNLVSNPANKPANFTNSPANSPVNNTVNNPANNLANNPANVSPGATQIAAVSLDEMKASADTAADVKSPVVLKKQESLSVDLLLPAAYHNNKSTKMNDSIKNVEDSLFRPNLLDLRTTSPMRGRDIGDTSEQRLKPPASPSTANQSSDVTYHSNDMQAASVAESVRSRGSLSIIDRENIFKVGVVVCRHGGNIVY